MITKELIKGLYNQKKYTVEEIAKHLNISFWSVYNAMKKYEISRRGHSEALFNFNKIKPQFETKINLSFAEEKLKIAGIMLYWAEGTLKRQTVDFANSSPQMVQLFLKFLREICGISEERLRVYLYAYPYQNLRSIMKYWNGITRIPLVQFTKPYVKKGTFTLSRRKLPYGLVHIRYNDKRLLEIIKSWINEYTSSSLIWAGT